MRKKNLYYPILDLVLNVLLYIFDAKKGCKKKGLSKLSLPVDLLKLQLNEIENICKIPLSETRNHTLGLFQEDDYIIRKQLK